MSAELLSADGSHLGKEEGLSPGCGRSESPSQEQQHVAGEAPSRAMYSSRNPVLGISEPLMEVPRSDDAPETVTESDCGQGAPGCGREDEQEQLCSPSSVRRRRNLVVQVSVKHSRRSTSS